MRISITSRAWRVAKQRLGVDVWLHKDDEFLYNGVVEQGMMFGLRVERQPPIDHFYEPGRSIAFGDFVVDVLHTPGHCPGGVCLAIGPAGSATRDLFVGDTLFAGSIGRTDLPGGDSETLLRSIRDVLFAFPDDTAVYSGHGPATTIGEERSDESVSGVSEPAAFRPPDARRAEVRRLRQVRSSKLSPGSTLNSTRPTVSTSPVFSTDRSTRLPLTSVPLVLPRSSTTN